MTQHFRNPETAALYQSINRAALKPEQLVILDMLGPISTVLTGYKSLWDSFETVNRILYLRVQDEDLNLLAEENSDLVNRTVHHLLCTFGQLMERYALSSEVADEHAQAMFADFFLTVIDPLVAPKRQEN